MSLNLHPLSMYILFIFAGATLKASDYLSERSVGILPYLIAGLSGFLLGILISEGNFSSAIILGIIIGAGLSAKIDKPSLIFGLVMVFFTAILLDFSVPEIWLLILVTIFAFVDEKGHDKFAGEKGLLPFFFRFRFMLKTGVIVLAVLLLLPFVYMVGFLLFDLSYDVTYIILSRMT